MTIVTISIVTTSTSHASALDDAQADWMRCLKAEIAQIDDGVSTASDVARSIRPSACTQEFRAMYGLMHPGASNMEYIMEMVESRPQAATRLVLEVRKERRQGKK